jgi:hypothetical protein
MKHATRLIAPLALLLALAGCSTGDKTVKDQTATTAEATEATEATEPFPDEGIASTTRPRTSEGRVGETTTLTETDTGRDVLRVAVDRIRFSTGDEYNRPERGLFLGVHVKVRALADDQTSLWGDFYVLQRGHHYDADGCCPEGFTPDLDYVDLNDGETAEGWLIFDVPARHGQVVLGQTDGGGKIATWSF